MALTFSKLFSSITESTIWVAPDAHRLCWITMLAMADRMGRVHASIPGLANRARVSVEDCDAAIKSFLAPDPYSRTQDFEGRRIEVIDGGWRLLNYDKYRALRDHESTLEAKRKYINERRAKERDESSFDTFWAAYPKKTQKIVARRAWAKVDVELDTLLAALDAQKRSEQWQRGVIPHAATWLNQRRWEDEPTDYGACKFCGAPAIGTVQGVPHCDIARHIDQARDWARNQK